MNVQIPTLAPGGYVNIRPSDIIAADRWRRTNDVRVRFSNGDFVIVSAHTARTLGQFGIIMTMLN